MRLVGPLVKSTATLVLLVVILRQIDVRDVMTRVGALQAGGVGLAAVLLAVQLWVHAWRWRQTLVRVYGIAVPMADLARCLGAGHLYGQLLPASVGLDVVRGGLLARRIGLTTASMAVVVDRISGLVALLVLIAMLLPALWLRLPGDDRVLALGGVAGVALLGLAALAVLQGRGAWRWLPEDFRRLLERTQAARAALRNGRNAGVLLSGGLAVQLLSVALVYVLAHAIAVPLPAGDALLIVPPALLIAALPLSIGGWGVREVALATAFTLVGLPMADGVAVSVLFGLTAPALGLAYGLFVLMARLRIARPA